MRIQVKSKNLELTDEVKHYAIEKLTSLERFLPDYDDDEVLAEIELERTTQHHQKGEIYRCEINLTIKGDLLRAEETGEVLTQAIDAVRDQIEREVRKRKEKSRTKFMRSARKMARKMKIFRFSDDE